MRLPEWRGPYLDLRDAWVGVFIDRDMWRTHVYVCLVPCFPIRLTWR